MVIDAGQWGLRGEELWVDSSIYIQWSWADSWKENGDLILHSQGNELLLITCELGREPSPR